LPSRFVDELPIEHVEPQSDTGYYNSGSSPRPQSRWDDKPFSQSSHDTPGWKRAQQASTNKAIYGDTGFGANLHGGNASARSNYQPARKAVIEGRARIIPPAPKPSGDWSRGDRVFHQKFGYGLVTAIEGNKLVVDFEKAGEKKVIDSFVEKS